jgi:pyrroloquinoline quinone (PQQ) biosynthesis protein C
MATTQPQQENYLYQPRVPWCQALVAEVLDPWRQRSLAHPLLQALGAGEVSRQTLAAMHSDVLWVVTAFPEYIAAFASRCPKYDHEMKAKLLENAYEERTHPRYLADLVNALGGDGDAILADHEWTYEPGDWAWHTKNWLECCAFHLPWIEGLAGTAVGIEAVVPTIFWPIMQALRTHYGLTDEQLTWHEIHSGEVEQSHGNNGLKLLERYVDPADTVTVNRCRRAVDRTCKLQTQEFLDYFWERRS